MSTHRTTLTENSCDRQINKDKHYDVPLAAPRKFEYKKFNILMTLYIHLAATYGLYLCVTSAKIGTLIVNLVWYLVGCLGITAGAHRLWTHRTYKAKPVFEFILMLFNCAAYQQSVTTWARDHRLHHKYSDTDADPHNARRGFFFSHVGWLLVKKDALVTEKGKTIDMSDIINNPILQFQKRYAIPLFGLMTFGLPTMIPVMCFGEILNTSWHVSMLRFVFFLNMTFLVNSATHIYGTKPYDKHILPSQNLFVSFFILGEGFHNYHHAFPWDYRTAELGNNFLNPTTLFLDFAAWMGWAYDLKTVKPEMIETKAKATGDNTNSWGF